MTEQSADKLNRLYSEMLVLLEKEKKIFDETERILAKAKAMIDPRKEFNKWLQSSEGQAWKQKQFEYQDAKCAYCGEDRHYPYRLSVAHLLTPFSFALLLSQFQWLRSLANSTSLKIIIII